MFAPTCKLISFPFIDSCEVAIVPSLRSPGPAVCSLLTVKVKVFPFVSVIVTLESAFNLPSSLILSVEIPYPTPVPFLKAIFPFPLSTDVVTVISASFNKSSKSNPS